MNTDSFFHKNEQEANLFVAKTTRITTLFMIFVYLLNAFHVFIIDPTRMLFSAIIGILLLLIPTLLINVLKLTSSYLKYINIICCILFSAVLIITLNYHVVLMFIYPIAIASIYFSQRLNIFTIVTSTVTFSIAQLLSYYIKAITDNNATSLFAELLFLITPRAIELIAISCIFHSLTKRTSTLLKKVINEEEQARILSNKSLLIANDLYGSMGNLTQSSEQTTEKNKKIVHLAASVSNASTETLSQLEEATQSMDSIATSIEKLSQSNEQVTALSKQVDTESFSNESAMNDAMISMQNIAESNTDCITIMNELNEKSQNISNIMEVITSIAEQTNLLSLNASIESARAGEQGRGFGVVAAEIGKLAKQSKDAVANIDLTIQDVRNNIAAALQSMNENSNLTTIGLHILADAKKSTDKVSNANHKIANKIEEVNMLSKEVLENSKTITAIVNSIASVSSTNVTDMQQVNTASEETFQSMQDLKSFISKIELLASDLKSLAA